jgi:hypothetical protein
MSFFNEKFKMQRIYSVLENTDVPKSCAPNFNTEKDPTLIINHEGSLSLCTLLLYTYDSYRKLHMLISCSRPLLLVLYILSQLFFLMIHTTNFTQTTAAAITALAMLSGASAHMKYFSNNTVAERYAFEGFKQEYGRTYENQEAEDKAFDIFVSNLQLIDARNAEELAAGGNAVHGITKFADMSQDEFRARFLTSKPNHRPVTVDIEPLPEGSAIVQDWRGIYTTPVKNQGNECLSNI